MNTPGTASTHSCIETMRRIIIVAAGLLLALSPVAQARAQGVAHVDRVSLTGFSLKEVPATGPGDFFAVFLTGDGGWTTLEKSVSPPLTAAGIPVVGFSQLWYLLRKRSPDRAAADLGRVIATYRAKWHRNSVVVIGYSRGAGIVPFAVNRLPALQREAVKVVVLLGAEHTTGFQLGIRDLFTTARRPDEVAVMPELRQIHFATIVCVYGEFEGDTLCPELPPPAILVKMPGTHHFGGKYAEIGTRIVEIVGAARGP